MTRRTRTLLVPASCTTALALVALCTAPGVASASTSTSTPARGTASSALSLLAVQAGGHTVSVGGVQMTSDTLTGSPLAKVVVTPVTADGQAYGTQTITPASSPVSVGSQTSPSALGSIVSLASPALSAAATNAPSTHAGTTSLGSLSVLGIPVPLNGSLDLGSAVSGTAGAVSQKTVQVTGLALPSIADLLGALGLDLSKLPVSTLTDLVGQLGLVTTAVDTAQQALTDAAADLQSKKNALVASNAALQQASDALAAVVATVDTTTYPTVTDLTSYLALGDKVPVNTDTPNLTSAYNTYTNAQSAVAAANALVNTAQGLVDTATTTLVGLVQGVLDGTPLVSLDSLKVISSASVSSAKAGGQHASITGGQVTGLKVLGTDVLDAALGSSTVDLTSLTGPAVSQVNGVLTTLTGTLSDVLSNVPGLPALKVPAPTVTLLGKSTSTGIVDGYGKALASLTGLRISIPGITVPSLAAVPGAASLPGISAVTGGLASAPLQLDLVNLSEQAAFAPAVTTVGSPSVTPTDLPHTGLPLGVAVLAVVATGGALVLRRRATS